MDAKKNLYLQNCIHSISTLNKTELYRSVSVTEDEMIVKE